MEATAHQAATKAGDTQLLKITEVQQRTKLSRSSIYAFMAAGRFPRALKIGSHSRWLESEVDAFIHELAAARGIGGAA
jgi:prophage regulatory protein